MRCIILTLISIFVSAGNIFALQYDKLSFNPAFYYTNVYYSKDYYKQVSSLYVYAPADISFNNIDATIRVNPFYSTHYDKASFAEAFLLLNYKHFSIKTGRQFLSFDKDFFIYLGSDNRFDNSLTSYGDGALLGLDYANFKAAAFWLYADDKLGGIDLSVLQDFPISLSLFSYFKQAANDELTLSGITARAEITSQLSLRGAFAFNGGSRKYSFLGIPFKKNYKGTAFLAEAKYYIPYQEFDLYFNAGYYFTSAAKDNSYAFNSITGYNIYGVFAASGNLLGQGIEAVKLNLNISPLRLKELNADIALFYYYSTLDSAYDKFIGSEWDFTLSYITAYGKISAYAGIFSPNKNFKQYTIPAENAVKIGGYITITNLF